MPIKDKFLLGLSVGLIILSFIFGASSGYEELVPVPSIAQAVTSTPGVTLSTNVQVALTASVDSGSQNLGNLTPGTPVFGTTTITISTNDNNGYSTRVSQNNTTTTASMLLNADGVTTFPELTDWAAGATTSTAGNATSTPLANLGFHVLQSATTSACNLASSWWGSNDTAGTALFTGFPLGGGNYSTSTIANCPSYQSGNTLVGVQYRADSPSSQKSGAYSGGITYTVFGN